METGRLYFNAETGRYGLMANGEWVIDGFHCGEPITIKIDGEWHKTRIELNENEEWYAVGFEDVVLYDHEARV